MDRQDPVVQWLQALPRHLRDQQVLASLALRQGLEGRKRRLCLFHLMDLAAQMAQEARLVQSNLVDQRGLGCPGPQSPASYRG